MMTTEVTFTQRLLGWPPESAGGCTAMRPKYRVNAGLNIRYNLARQAAIGRLTRPRRVCGRPSAIVPGDRPSGLAERVEQGLSSPRLLRSRQCRRSPPWKDLPRLPRVVPIRLIYQ